MVACTVCKEKYSWEEIAEWRADHEDYNTHPLICPDCYSNLRSKDLEDQFSELTAVR